MKRLGLLLLALLVPGQAWATVTCTASDFVAGSGTASTTLAITITVPSQTNRRPVIAISDRSDETTTISSVVDNNSGTWTCRGACPDDMSTGATIRTWFYEQSTLGGTGSTTVTVTFSGAINSSGVAGTCYGSGASLDYVSSAAYAEHTTTSSWTSNTRDVTSAGVVISDLHSSGGNCDVSSVGTNQTEMTSPTGSRVTQIVTRPETSGTFGTDWTLGFNCTGQVGAHLYQEASAAAETFGFRLRLAQ
jgi:hypothetical protein